jgi:hypothetical protein
MRRVKITIDMIFGLMTKMAGDKKSLAAHSRYRPATFALP